MLSLMFASSEQMTLEAIQSVVPDEYETAIEEKLGGVFRILCVRKGGDLFVDFNVHDEEDNGYTMDDFAGVTEPSSFAIHLTKRRLHFVLVNCSENHKADVHQILAACVRSRLVEFDATSRHTIRKLDEESTIV